MHAKTPMDAVIHDLLSEEVLRTVADAIAGLRPDNIPAVIQTDQLASVHSVLKLYGNTAGPFDGIGGAVVTWFRLTVIYSEEIMLLFANKRFYGFTGFDPGILRDVDEKDFLRVPLREGRTEHGEGRA